MKTVLTATSLFALALSLSAQATTITVHDGDIFNYDTGVDVFFDATLSVNNPWVTFGTYLSSDQSFDFVVTVPPDMPFPGMYALLSTQPNFGGVILGGPNSYYAVFPGEQFTFPVDGRYGHEQWISLGIADADNPAAVTPEMVSYLSGFPNGDIPIGQPLSNPDGSGQSFTYYGGDSSGSGTSGSGSGAGVTPVPEPSAWLLFAGGMALLGFMVTRRSGRSSAALVG